MYIKRERKRNKYKNKRIQTKKQSTNRKIKENIIPPPSQISSESA
jgi:hypothetical protein